MLGPKAQTSKQPLLTTRTLPLRLRSLRDFSQFFDHFFRAVIAAGFAFAVAIVDADVKLPDIRLLSFRS